MNASAFLEHKEDIHICARDFRRDANHIMAQLANEFKFNIQPSISFPKEVYRHYNNKGVFKGQWSFYFHGSHCHFENLVTGQILEVLFILSPEFGYFNPFFFLVFIRTTPKYNYLNEILNEENIDLALEMLTNAGKLLKIEYSISKHLFLANE